MKAKPLYFIVQVFSSFLIAFLDGLSLGLLVPLAKGIIEMNFSFLEDAPFFKNIIGYFPELFDKAPAKAIFIILVTIIFTAAAMKSVMEYISALYAAFQKEKYIANVKKFIFARYLTFGKLFFDRNSQGSISETLGFSKHIGDFLDAIVAFFHATFTISIYAILMVMISWRLSIFAALIFLVLHYSLKWIIQKIGKTGKQHTEASLRLGREVFNILTCMPLIKAYNKENEVNKKFVSIVDLIRQLNYSMLKKIEIIKPLQEIIMLASILLMISAAAFLFVKERLGGISGFFVFFYIIRRSMPLFGKFNHVKAQFIRSKAPIKEVLNVCKDEEKYFVLGGNKVFSEIRNKIEFRDLNYSYIKDILVLKNINLSIEKGKMTAIVGPTGSGKTTITSLIMRFYDCPPGAIFINDVDIKEFTVESIREHIALVSQDTLILNDTVRLNIAFGVKGKTNDKKILEAAKKARIYDFIMKLPKGMDTEVGDRGVKLSGGERQRLSIARALLKDSNILILDEATSSLDTHTEHLIQEAIEEVVKGRTTIVIAHRLSTVKNADNIIVIEDGKLVEKGPLKLLISMKGKFYNYWEEQKFY